MEPILSKCLLGAGFGADSDLADSDNGGKAGGCFLAGNLDRADIGSGDGNGQDAESGLRILWDLQYCGYLSVQEKPADTGSGRGPFLLVGASCACSVSSSCLLQRETGKRAKICFLYFLSGTFIDFIHNCKSNRLSLLRRKRRIISVYCITGDGWYL